MAFSDNPKSSDMNAAKTVATAAASLIVAVAALAAPAWERQLDMKAMADAAKLIEEMFSGKRPYSQKDFQVAAETIQERSGERLSESYRNEPPTGDSKANSDAIAASAEEFERMARELELYASALVTAAEQNQGELGPETRMKGSMLLGCPFGRKAHVLRDAASVPAEHAFHMMLQTCTSCHQRFRLPQR